MGKTTRGFAFKTKTTLVKKGNKCSTVDILVRKVHKCVRSCCPSFAPAVLQTIHKAIPVKKTIDKLSFPVFSMSTTRDEDVIIVQDTLC